MSEGESFKTGAEKLADVLLSLEVCNSNHKGKLVEGCPICTFRAVNVIYHPKDVDVAKAFLAKLDKQKIRSDITVMREVWGKSAPEWMFKPEYL